MRILRLSPLVVVFERDWRGGIPGVNKGFGSRDQVACQCSLPWDLQGSQRTTAQHADGGAKLGSLAKPKGGCTSIQLDDSFELPCLALASLLSNPFLDPPGWKDILVKPK